jgi:glycine/D-amino acid oxidase-like deaminating enzyme
VTPDHNPIIGPVPGLENVVVVVGHSGYGLQLGPYSAALAADLAIGKSIDFDIRPFVLDRFLGD